MKKTTLILTTVLAIFLFSCGSDDTIETKVVPENTPNSEVKAFITTWKTDNEGVSEDNQIRITTATNEVYDYEIDWGDGSKDINVTGSITHSYAIVGIYRIAITGKFPRIINGFGMDSSKLLSIDQWGDIQWTSMESAFKDCKSLTSLNAKDTPNLNEVRSLKLMFFGSDSFNADLSNWDVSKVSDMAQMFEGARSFNSDLSSWDVSKVTNMSGMFREMKSFNGDISSWDVSNVINMGGMFSGFTSFNSNISNWNVSKVADMGGMFSGATSFNGDISSWDVSKVINISHMFAGATSFNGDISSWNVSEVTNMGFLFTDATSFDGDISNWDVSKVTDMTWMFFRTTSFKGNISSWDVSKVISMDDMLAGVRLSLANYSLILREWSKLNLQSNVPFSADSRFSTDLATSSARDKLINTFNWTIKDLGPVEFPPLLPPSL